MSTVPGPDALRDAGLPDEIAHLAHRDDTDGPDGSDDGGDYRPDAPRPDLDGLADEADVVEQADEVPFLADDPDEDVD